MRRRLEILVILFLAFGYGTQAQNLKGTIQDTDGKPLQDVTIRILNTNLGTVSDNDGKFTVANITPNTVLHFSSIGFASKEEIISDSVLVVTLLPSAVLLRSEITVTAQRYEKNLFDVPQAVSILGEQDLLQNSPRITPEALFGSTGIWIQKTNHGGGSPIIRGLVGNQVLLMIDGIRMNNATYRYGPNQYLATIDPALIHRIEATRGNGSVLYGSDALGGVVQVISKSPAFSDHGTKVNGSFRGKWASADMEKSGRAEIGVSKKRFAIAGGFSLRDFGDIVAGGNLGTLTPTGYREHSGDAKLLFRTGSSGVLIAAYQHHAQADVPRYDQVAQGGYSRYDFEPQSRQLSYLRWETLLHNSIFQSLKITSSFNRSTEGIVSQKNGSTDSKEQLDIADTWGFIVETHSTVRNHWQAQSGVEYYHDVVKSRAKNVNMTTNQETSVRGSYADGATCDNVALFTNHTIDWNKFQLSGGGRFNMVRVAVDDITFGHSTINPGAFVGNIGIIYKFHPNHHLIVAANTGFRAPNVDDLSKFGAVESTVFEVPSTQLAPERSLSIEAGLKSNAENFSFSFSVYHTKLSDLIDRVPIIFQGQDSIENRKVYQKQNVGEAELFGMEADSELKITKSIVAFGNITYTRGENTSKDEPMRRIPPLFGKVGLRYGDLRGFWFKAEWLYAGEQGRLATGDLSDARIAIRLNDNRMPGWNVLNFYTGYGYGKMNLSLSMQNILDEPYRVYASGVDSPGRCFIVSAGMKL